MDNDELRRAFDRQARSYDKQWSRMAPINDGMFFLLDAVLASLPGDARILCVGVGTGTELIHLAMAFPGWTFTAVDPSTSMLDICRQRVGELGLSGRCVFHEGYIDSLPEDEHYDATMCFLVSQFILDARARTQFFGQIASRLVPGGILATSDLSTDIESPVYDALLPVWQRVMTPSSDSAEALERMREGYARDVAILPPAAVASIIESAGFDPPVRYFQAALICGWFARRSP